MMKMTRQTYTRQIYKKQTQNKIFSIKKARLQEDSYITVQQKKNAQGWKDAQDENDRFLDNKQDTMCQIGFTNLMSKLINSK